MLKAFGILGGSVLAFVLPLVIAAAPARAAQAERQIDCGVPVSNYAVVVVKVTLGDTVVPCYGEHGPPNRMGPFQPAPPFQADDDWLRNVTIYLFNRTNKNIVWAQLRMGFPQTGDGLTTATAQRTFSMALGRRPAVANLDPHTGQPMPPEGTPLSFAAGQTLPIRLGDYSDEIRNHIRDVLPAPVTKITFSWGFFIFEDGMSWSPTAQFGVPDPDRPGYWKSMPFDYFPGDVHANWPADRIKVGRE
jgi:hypothetical protein